MAVRHVASGNMAYWVAARRSHPVPVHWLPA